jgi:CubicO group peptidase (beta-lactamase class C family)
MLAVALKVDVPSTLLRGGVDEGYGRVADAFRRNFAEGGEIGAPCALYRDGKKVVDLWGGYRDGVTRAQWREDTVVVMYSTTKGVCGLALALAHSRGLLDYDEPVATYWPSSPGGERARSRSANCCHIRPASRSSTYR